MHHYTANLEVVSVLVNHFRINTAYIDAFAVYSLLF